MVSNITPTLSFSSSTILYQYSANFWDFWMLRSKFVKLLRSVLNSQVSPSSNFLQMFLFSVMKDTPLKGTFPALGFSTLSKRIPSKSTFWEFECSGQKFPNSYCHFWKHNSVFFQVLYQYSVSLSITHLYFISWSIIYFGQKQSIKM